MMSLYRLNPSYVPTRTSTLRATCRSMCSSVIFEFTAKTIKCEQSITCRWLHVAGKTFSRIFWSVITMNIHGCNMYDDGDKINAFSNTDQYSGYIMRAEYVYLFAYRHLSRV